MKTLPKQVYIFALALLLYCSPLPLFFGEESQRYILPGYVALQVLFVIACYKLVNEKWISLVILIEAFCMTWNCVLFFRWQNAGEVFHTAYSYVMFLSLVLEILIINLSITGGVDEQRNAGQYPKRPLANLLCRLNPHTGIFSCKEAAK